MARFVTEARSTFLQGALNVRESATKEANPDLSRLSNRKTGFASGPISYALKEMDADGVIRLILVDRHLVSHQHPIDFKIVQVYVVVVLILNGVLDVGSS